VSVNAGRSPERTGECGSPTLPKKFFKGFDAIAK
jgi:hypothetical protein